MVTIEGFFQSLWTWIVSFFNNFIPNYILPNLQLIIQVFILLVVAYVVGKIGKFIVTRILSASGFKRITTRTWAESILRVTGYRGTIVGLIGDLVKWLIYIAFLAVIIETIGFPGVADLFAQLAVFMPRFIGAIIIVVIGFIVADFFGRVFEEAGRRFLKEDILASLSGGIVKYSIAIVVIIMALSLMGIDPTSLTVMFAIILVAFMAAILIGIRDIFPSYTASLPIRQSIKIGDKIKIGQHSGLVEKIEPLSVTLKKGRKRIIIPNSILIKEPIEKI